MDPYKAAHGHAYLHNATVDRTDILREQYNDLYQRFIRMIWSFAVIILVQFFATVFVIVLLVNKLS